MSSSFGDSCSTASLTSTGTSGGGNLSIMTGAVYYPNKNESPNSANTLSGREVAAPDFSLQVPLTVTLPPSGKPPCSPIKQPSPTNHSLNAFTDAAGGTRAGGIAFTGPNIALPPSGSGHLGSRAEVVADSTASSVPAGMTASGAVSSSVMTNERSPYPVSSESSTTGTSTTSSLGFSFNSAVDSTSARLPSTYLNLETALIPAGSASSSSKRTARSEPPSTSFSFGTLNHPLVPANLNVPDVSKTAAGGATRSLTSSGSSTGVAGSQKDMLSVRPAVLSFTPPKSEVVNSGNPFALETASFSASAAKAAVNATLSVEHSNITASTSIGHGGIFAGLPIRPVTIGGTVSESGNEQANAKMTAAFSFGANSVSDGPTAGSLISGSLTFGGPTVSSTPTSGVVGATSGQLFASGVNGGSSSSTHPFPSTGIVRPSAASLSSSVKNTDAHDAGVFSFGQAPRKTETNSPAQFGPGTSTAVAGSMVTFGQGGIFGSVPSSGMPSAGTPSGGIFGTGAPSVVTGSSVPAGMKIATPLTNGSFQFGQSTSANVIGTAPSSSFSGATGVGSNQLTPGTSSSSRLGVSRPGATGNTSGGFAGNSNMLGHANSNLPGSSTPAPFAFAASGGFVGNNNSIGHANSNLPGSSTPAPFTFSSGNDAAAAAAVGPGGAVRRPRLKLPGRK
jgi:hypothetical protein